MRRFLVFLSLGLLAGCATVSVVPGETTVESALTHNQSALRIASDAYCDKVADKGWAEADQGIAGFAGMLLRGRAAASAPASYATSIGAETRAPALVLARISTDSEAARLGLEAVTREARAVLAGQSSAASERGDIMSYERALVRAQMSHRSFRQALDLVSARADLDITPIETEIGTFAASIDEARQLADRLADRYANVGQAAS